MKRLIFALMIGALIPSTAIAQSICDSREELVDHLESAYFEKQAGFGLSKKGALIEIYVSKETGTFSIIQTTPTGVSCLMSAGDVWVDIWLEEDKGPAY